MRDLKELRAGEAAMLLEELAARGRKTEKELKSLIRKGKVQPVVDLSGWMD